MKVSIKESAKQSENVRIADLFRENSIYRRRSICLCM